MSAPAATAPPNPSPPARPVRWLVRAGVALALLLLIGAAVVGWIAWRAAGTPAWYTQAAAVRFDSPEADTALNRHVLPVQNWMARVTSGPVPPDRRPPEQRQATLSLSETQINALLAWGRDSVPGPLRTPRVRLTPGRIDLACTVADWNRVVGASVLIDANDRGEPTVRSGGVRLGEQAVPLAWALSWAPGDPLAKLRASLDNPPARRRPGRDKPLDKPLIDEHDLADHHAAEAYYGRLLLDLLAGQSVTPLALLPGAGNGDDLVATKLTRLDVTDGRLSMTFRLLDAGERAAAITELERPATPSK